MSKLYSTILDILHRLKILMHNIKVLISHELSPNSDIKANIPSTTKFPHHKIGVVIHSKAQIGEYCKIWQNVTIASSHNTGGDPPIIEDNVHIYANAVIFGNITIGHHSVIGAGAIVFKNVPPYSLVVGHCNIYEGKYAHKNQ